MLPRHLKNKRKMQYEKYDRNFEFFFKIVDINVITPCTSILKTRVVFVLLDDVDDDKTKSFKINDETKTH